MAKKPAESRKINSTIYRIYYVVVVVVSLFTLVVCLVSERGEGYEFLPIIPGLYLPLFCLNSKLHKLSVEYLGMMLLNIVMFVKYVITNLATCLFSEYDLPSYYVNPVSNSSFFHATLVITVEMISISYLIALFSDIFYGRTKKRMPNIEEYEPVNVGPVLVVVLGACAVLILANADLYLSKTSILFSENNALTETLANNNALSLIFHAFNTLLFGLLVNGCIVRFKETGKRLYIVLSYVLMGALTFLSVSTSRINMILPFVLFILITSKEFGRTGIVLDFVTVILLLGLFSVVSSYKNPWRYFNDVSAIDNVLEFARGLQEYTSGIMPTAMGLQATSYYREEISLITLFNDIFGAMPGVAGMIDQENRLNWYYNQYALGGSSVTQIIPMSVSSATYFTPVFSFLLVDCCVVLLMVVDSNSRYGQHNFLNKYLSSYLLFVLAAAMISNVQMVAGRIFVNYVPPLLTLILNERVSIRSSSRPPFSSHRALRYRAH